MRTFARFSRPCLQTSRMLACLSLLTLMSGCCRTNGWIMNNSGMGYYQKGNYSMARKEFERAVIDSPKSADYRHNLAMAMQKQGDTARAEQVLRHNLSVNPMHQPTYHALSQMLVSQNRTAEADHLLAGWRDTQPYVPEAYVEQAWFQHETGNKVAAEQNLRQALQIKPNHPVALAQLGQLYHESGQVAPATEYYQRSLLSRWNQPEVHSRLASLTGSTSSMGNMRRSAMVHNDANIQMVSMGQMPMNGGQPIVTMGGMPAGEMVAFEEPGRRHRRHQHHNHQHAHGGGAQQITAYPLPNYGLADNGFQSGIVTAEQPVNYPPMMSSAPTVISGPMISSQPVLAPPTVATGPTPIPQADPSHATEMTASLPVVDPH